VTRQNRWSFRLRNAAPPAAELGLTYPGYRKVWATERAKIEFVGLDPYAHLR
jgi:hypothetical protein